MTQPKKRRKRLTEYFGGYIDGKLCDLVRDEDGHILFQLVGETVELKSELILDDKVLIPPVKVPWNVPPPITQEDIDNYDPNQYLREIKDYLHKYVEFQQKSQYDLLGMWVMATWIKEVFPVYSYLHMRGPKSCGKSKVLEVLAPISYRGILTASPSEATMFREIEGKGVTYFIDDLEQEDIDKRNLLGLLDSGYRRGWLYSRCGSNEDRTVEYFNVSGFKAFSSRDDFKDVLESRCISIHMTKTKRKVPLWIEECDSLKVLKSGSVTKSVIYQTAIKQAQKKEACRIKNSSKSVTSLCCDGLCYNNINSIYNNNILYSTFVTENILVQCRTEELFAYTLLLASHLSQAVPAIGFEIPKCVTDVVIKTTQEKLEEDTYGEESIALAAIVDLLNCHGWDYPLSSTRVAEIINHEFTDRKDRWSLIKTSRILQRVGFKHKRNRKGRYHSISKDRLKKELGDFGVEYPEELFSDSFGGSGVDGTLKPKAFDMSGGASKEKKKDTERSKAIKLLKVISEVEGRSKEEVASFEEIREAMGMGVEELTELIEKERQGPGHIYSPRHGFYKVTEG